MQRESAGPGRAVGIVRDRAIYHARHQHQRQGVRVGGEQKPQRMRQRQHPLPQGTFGQHFIGQQRSGLGSPQECLVQQKSPGSFPPGPLDRSMVR